MKTTAAYNQDFHAWLLHNAALLRERNFTAIDADNIAEELETMGRSEKRELISRLSVLIAHLLKWRHQPVRRSRSWRNTIATQRLDIKELLEDSPSLNHDIEEQLEKAYSKAVLLAELETGIDRKLFPPSSPFSWQELLDEDFLPEA
ncbi:DUF29 domain-containing protein [Candidatus Electronema sp. JC]|uniref:DUF29 domain-containing protein n=1 Tax=Candidatus Electronema sp. JC TaxID=3401570 RepID=UPI003B42CEB5